MNFYHIDGRLINLDSVDYIEPYQEKGHVTNFVFKANDNLVVTIPFEEIIDNISIIARMERKSSEVNDRIRVLTSQVEILQHQRAPVTIEAQNPITVGNEKKEEVKDG